MDNQHWRRPFTPKRYLHPPLTENLITLWPDFRVMIGDIVEQPHQQYHSSAFRLLAGPQQKPPDFTAVRQITRPDGVPVHTLEAELDGAVLTLEAFCDIRRVPAAYCRIRVDNPTAWPLAGQLALLARSGDERHLTGMEVDGYAHFSNEVGNWGFLENGFAWDGAVLDDGEYQLRLQHAEAFSPHWRSDEDGLPWHRRHLLLLSYSLAPGEGAWFELCFRHGEATPFDYKQELGHTKRFWVGELAKMENPPSVEGAPRQAVVHSLVAQCLQMFCHPVGRDYVYPRQGGMQRAIWPVEALEFLIALDRMGGYFSYTDAAYTLFFDVMQEKDGTDAGMVRNFPGYQQWAGVTAGALWGLARHILFSGDKSVFMRYRAAALLAFEWIEQKRHHGQPGAIDGIFPPMQASDWDGGHFQSWCLTDATALVAFRWLHAALEHFGDGEAGRVGAAYADYMARMQAIMDNELAANTREGEILITNRAGLPMPDPPKGPYMSDGPAMLLRAGVIAPGSEAARLCENYFRRRGMMQNGLTGLMNDGQLRQGHCCDPWAGHTWYTSFSDLCWFAHWLRQGECDKALVTLNAQFKYAMTPEYYMNERYADNDPYFVPWLPNASANGRTLMMLYAWHDGEEDI